MGYFEQNRLGSCVTNDLTSTSLRCQKMFIEAGNYAFMSNESTNTVWWRLYVRTIRLRALRRLKRLTQQDLAREVGISVSLLSTIERVRNIRS